MLEPLTLSGAQLCLCCCCLLQNFAVVGLIACVKRQLIVNLVGVKQALCEVDFVAVALLNSGSANERCTLISEPLLNISLAYVGEFCVLLLLAYTGYGYIDCGT